MIMAKRIGSVLLAAALMLVVTVKADAMQQVWKVQLNEGQIVTALTFSPRGNRLVLGMNNGQLAIYGTVADKHADWVTKPLFEGPIMPDKQITALAFDPEQKVLAVGAGDGTMYFSNNTGVVMKSFKFPAAVKQIMFSPSGTRALVLCDSSTVWVVNMADYSQQTYNYKFFRPVTACFGGSDNEIIEGLSNANGEIVKGNIDSNRATLKTAAERFGIAAMAVKASANLIAVSGKDSSSISFFEMDSLQPAGGIASLEFFEHLVFGNGDFIVGGCGDGSIKVYSTIDGSQCAAEYYGQMLRAMAVKPDAGYIAAAYNDGGVCIFSY